MIPSNNIDHKVFFLSCAPRQIKARKDSSCTYCWRPIHKGQMKYYYSSGFRAGRRRGKGMNRDQKWFNLHIRCGVVLIQINIDRLKKSLQCGSEEIKPKNCSILQR